MDPSAFISDKWRIRAGDTVALNTDSGWAAAENVDATIGTGIVWRWRATAVSPIRRGTGAGASTRAWHTISGWSSARPCWDPERPGRRTAICFAMPPCSAPATAMAGAPE